MRKILFALVALVCSISVNAQTIKVYNGEDLVATYSSAQADQVVFEESVPFTVDVKAMSVSEYTGTPMAQYPDYRYMMVIFENPTAKVVEGYYGLWESSAWSDEELNTPETTFELMTQYGLSFETEELAGLNGEPGVDPCEWLYGNRKSNTEYVAIIACVDENGNKYTGYAKHTTAVDPTASENYAKWLGDYTFTVNGKNFPAHVVSKVAEESIILDMSGDDEYIEDFAPVATWNKEDNTMTITAQNLGSWTHPQYGEVNDMVYGFISYNGGYPIITGSNYPLAKLSLQDGNIVMESAGKININGLGERDLVGMSLFGSTSAGNLRYVDQEDFIYFPVTFTKAAATAKSMNIAPVKSKMVSKKPSSKKVVDMAKSLSL